MSSQEEKPETDEKFTAKIGDFDSSQAYIVVDEVASDSGNEVTSEDEPEILFIKEESCHFVPGESSPKSSDRACTEVEDAQEDDEPEVVFFSEHPVVLLPTLRLEPAIATSNDQLTIHKDTLTSQEETLSPSEDVPGVSFFEDTSGMFCLDTTPEVGKDKPLGPRFTREFSSTLKSEDNVVCSPGNGTKQDNRCFNCMGDHTLMNCPHPKNQKEISKNRSMFQKYQPRMNRYHLDKPYKFDHFTPGVISEELRDALGLRSSDIPLHVYQMRILGYPPGWIEHIKQYSSGLEMIDIGVTPSSMEGIEQVTYNYDGVIDYPGFNVPVARSVRDEWLYLNFPPMQDYNSKEVLVRDLKMQNEAQISSSEESGTNLDIIDMDTSIEDLEEQRKALLAELDEDDDDDPEEIAVQNPTTETDGSETNLHSLEESQPQSSTNEVVGGRCIQATTAVSPFPEPSPVAVENTNINDQSLSPKKSKLLAMGTPVSIRHSPFSTLPARDKFAHNGSFGKMGELELYENLPNSTGAFQKMRSLLQKVKKVFNKK